MKLFKTMLLRSTTM